MRLKLKRLIFYIFLVLVCLVVVHKLFYERESFAPVGIEVWQSSRVNNPTRNMSYDIRGQPSSAPFDPYVSPWNISSIEPTGMAQPPTTPIMTKHQFETNSIGLTLPDEKIIEHGYLAGWPETGDIPTAWLNPALLNQDKRWGFYSFDK